MRAPSTPRRTPTAASPCSSASRSPQRTVRYRPTMTQGNESADPSALDRAIAQYFPPPADTATHVADSQWVPFVDGESYFAEIDEQLGKAGPGDTILASGLEIIPDLDLRGRSSDDPD